MLPIKYIREGRGLCKKCANERDVVSVPGHMPVAMSRHLRRIEEYGPKGATPTGFCDGSFGEFNPLPTPPSHGSRARK